MKNKISLKAFFLVFLIICDCSGSSVLTDSEDISADLHIITRWHHSDRYPEENLTEELHRGPLRVSRIGKCCEALVQFLCNCIN